MTDKPRPIAAQLEDCDPNTPFRFTTTQTVNASIYEVLLTIQALEERISQLEERTNVQTETIGHMLVTNDNLRARIVTLETQLVPRGAEK